MENSIMELRSVIGMSFNGLKANWLRSAPCVRRQHSQEVRLESAVTGRLMAQKVPVLLPTTPITNVRSWEPSQRLAAASMGRLQTVG